MGKRGVGHLCCNPHPRFLLEMGFHGPPLLLMFCPHPWFLKNFILDRINRLRPVPV